MANFGVDRNTGAGGTGSSDTTVFENVTVNGNLEVGGNLTVDGVNVLTSLKAFAVAMAIALG